MNKTRKVLPAAVFVCAVRLAAEAAVLRADEPEPAPATTWRAGVARASITPETPVWLAGYGSKRVPDGKLHDLWMKALALEAPDGSRVALITSDFQGVPKGYSDLVFERARERFGLDRARLMFTYSHNHCGPRLGDDLIDYYPVEPEQETLVAEYTERMAERAVDLIGEAFENLGPAILKTGAGRTNFAVNRRENTEAEVAEALARGEPLRGVVDHAVPVLSVTRPDGAEAAILFGYACHPTTLSFNTYCGDYPGFAQVALERGRPGTAAMFVNTCGGDQNPIPRRSLELCERYGGMLAAAVEETLRRPMKPIEPGLRVAFEMIELRYEKVVDADDLKRDLKHDNPIRARWAARLLAKLEAGERFEPFHPYPLRAWRLGADTLFLGMGGETVVDYALRFKREFGAGTWVLGYADDMVAYIPSRRVWEEGGYEGGAFLYEYGRPALRWAGDVEDRIVSGIHRVAGRVGVPAVVGDADATSKPGD